MRAIGEEMEIGVPIDDFSQTFAKFTIQKAHDLTHALKRETFAPKLADHGHFGELVEGIEAAMSFAIGLHHSSLIPPLQLARRDAGSRDHLL